MPPTGPESELRTMFVHPPAIHSDASARSASQQEVSVLQVRKNYRVDPLFRPARPRPKVPPVRFQSRLPALHIQPPQIHRRTAPATPRDPSSCCSSMGMTPNAQTPPAPCTPATSSRAVPADALQQCLHSL